MGGFHWVHLVPLAASTVWLLVSDYSLLSDYTVHIHVNCNAPMTFEEIVMVMIKPEILPCLISRPCFKAYSKIAYKKSWY